MSDETAAEKAREALTPEKFDFAQAVMDRSYPEIETTIYLDEAKMQRVWDARTRRLVLENKVAGRGGNASQADAKAITKLTEEYEQLIDSLRAEAYIVTIKGVPTDKLKSILAEVDEKFPIEYEEAVSPITGGKSRTEIENPERDEFYSMKLRQAYIISVAAPNGAVDTDFSELEKVKVIWSQMPTLARAQLDQAINEATVSLEFFQEFADEVF